MQEARITTNASRQAEDTFLVTSSETGQKLEDDTLDGVSEHLRRSLRRGPGVKSGQPLIYGEAAALDVAALKARQAARAAGGAAEGAAAAGTDAKAVAAALRDAEALELAAAELAVAASALVSAERAALAAAAAAVAATDKPGLEAGAERLDEAEAARADCALALERRISALEAAVASRRSPKASVADRLREERLRELVEGGRPAAPADVGAVSGPGLGSGGEVVLQARPGRFGVGCID